ncbi:GNAT family N-acetyltransferase [Streptomyces sp. NBC_00091]|uniref:GNAT family N-acetyltransferase n=1 Tax=Streptomyces sp. NBC_00091 TaxID=2975648 RepID=UPI0022543894|nr:GNAT family protein [Streptomyces sp. NBC_00091]MCX5375679.1 GNAT family N-acetyltransferase [Streptomyces sp. NBC_00091]
MFAIDLAEDAQLFPLEVWHAEEFLAHMDRGREFIGQFVGFPDRATDLESARLLLGSNAEKAAKDGARLYGIRVDGTLVGGVLFPNFDAARGNCEVGCWLEPTAAGRGLITKACRVLIDWAFQQRGMHRVEWHVASGNKKSIAVAERLGLTREGVLRQNHLHRGVRQDTEVWAVLAHEWATARPA